MKFSFFIIIFYILSVYSLVIAQPFIEQTNAIGVSGSYTSGGGGGGSISLSDFNNDGMDDITFATGSNDSLRFFVNEAGQFTEIFPNGIDNTDFVRQAVWVDIENDGDKDLFVTAYFAPNLLYINDGNFNFTESTFLFGLPMVSFNTYGVNFADMNRDGYLDLYISNLASQNELYLFNPQTMQYENFTTYSGAGNGINFTFCTSFFDYDFDGDLDFYVSNDGFTYANAFYRNNGDSTFTDISNLNGSNILISSMNTGVGDYNNDGYWDIYCTNLGTAPSVMLTGTMFGLYTDNSIISNTTFNRFGWGGNFWDFNNDSFEDLYVVGTMINAGAPNAFYLNNGNGTFSEPYFNSYGIGGSDTLSGYVNSTGDFNLDGYGDIFTSDASSNPFKVFVNYNQNSNKYLKLDLEGTQSNIDGIGALIEVWYNNSKRIFHKHIANAFLSQNSDLIHIGFGNSFNLDSIVIKWQYGNNKNVIPASSFSENKIYRITELNNTINELSNVLCNDINTVSIDPIPSQIYGSNNKTSSSSKIINGAEVVFRSNELIELLNNFEIEAGSFFSAEINSCNGIF